MKKEKGVGAPFRLSWIWKLKLKLKGPKGPVSLAEAVGQGWSKADNRKIIRYKVKSLDFPLVWGQITFLLKCIPITFRAAAAGRPLGRSKPAIKAAARQSLAGRPLGRGKPAIKRRRSWMQSEGLQAYGPCPRGKITGFYRDLRR